MQKRRSGVVVGLIVALLVITAVTGVAGRRNRGIFVRHSFTVERTIGEAICDKVVEIGFKAAVGAVFGIPPRPGSIITTAASMVNSDLSTTFEFDTVDQRRIMGRTGITAGQGAYSTRHDEGRNHSPFFLSRRHTVFRGRRR